MDGYIFRTGSYWRILLPDGKIWTTDPSGKDRKKLKWKTDGKTITTPTGRLATFDSNAMKKILSNFRKLQKKNKNVKEPKKVKKVKPKVKKSTKPKVKPKAKKIIKPKVKPKVKKIIKPKVKPKVTPSTVSKKDIQDIVFMELKEDYFLATYNHYNFFIWKTAKEGEGIWSIAAEKRGHKEIIPSTFDTKEEAALYFKTMKDREATERKRLRSLKGGTDLGKYEWLAGDRILYDSEGDILIGTVTNKGIGSINVTFDIGEKENIKVTDPDIIGVGISKNSDKPIPIADIKKWMGTPRVTERKWRYEKKGTWNLSPEMEAQLPTAFETFCEKAPKMIKDSHLRKTVQEFLLEHKLLIGEQRDLVDGSYWKANNDISIGWTFLFNITEYAAYVLLHEVLHYKMQPKKKAIKTFLKNNILRILELDPDQFKVKKWYKAYMHDFPVINSMDAVRILSDFGYGNISMEEAYGLVQYFETPSVFLGLTPTGTKLKHPNLKKLRVELYKQFRKWLTK